jgi:hypothetical protein
MAPSAMPTLVQGVPTMVQVARQTVEILQMTSL